jgi:hypothetical protein
MKLARIRFQILNFSDQPVKVYPNLLTVAVITSPSNQISLFLEELARNRTEYRFCCVFSATLVYVLVPFKKHLVEIIFWTRFLKIISFSNNVN